MLTNKIRVQHHLETNYNPRMVICHLIGATNTNASDGSMHFH